MAEVVVDANVVLNFVNPLLPFHDQAKRLLSDLIGQGYSLLAPPIAAAEMRHCEFWTGDERLFNGSAAVGLTYVRFLGNY